MLVETLMTPSPVTVLPETTLVDAGRVMLEQHLSGLPVLNANNRLTGIITEGDLLRRPELGTEGAKSSWAMAFFMPSHNAEDYARTHTLRVREAMSCNPITVSPQTPLSEAAALMVRKRIKLLPVTKADGTLVGMLARRDMLKALVPKLSSMDHTYFSPEAVKQHILETLARESWAPKSGVRVEVSGDCVTLEGAVFSDAERRAVHVVAENAPGVKQVEDRLVYVDPGTGMAFPLA